MFIDLMLNCLLSHTAFSNEEIIELLIIFCCLSDWAIRFGFEYLSESLLAFLWEFLVNESFYIKTPNNNAFNSYSPYQIIYPITYRLIDSSEHLLS